MKKLVLTVVAEHHRDIYNAMKSAIEMVDVDFTSAAASAPCFDFDFYITDSIDLSDVKKESLNDKGVRYA